jgi:G3E family GTPase
VSSVNELLERYGDRLERLIVETSGLADPAPVLQTFLADPDIRDRVELESVVAVVDACHAKAQLDDDIAREQVVFADRIIINKSDVASRADVTALVELIRSLNPSASIDVSHQSAVDVNTLLGVRSFSLDNLLSVEPGLLDDGEHDHEHDSSIASCAFIVPGSLDAGRFNRWINQLVQSQGQSLLRMKGVLSLNGEARRLHFHSVHMLLDSRFGKPWSGEARDSKFVVIGRNLDEAQLRDGLLSCTS